MASDEAERLAAFLNNRPLTEWSSADGIAKLVGEWLRRPPAAPPPAQEGWRCVPVEPTPAMLGQLMKGYVEGSYRDESGPEPRAMQGPNIQRGLLTAWRLALAAFPSPPAHVPCPHNNVQSFTDVCLDCGRNIHEQDTAPAPPAHAELAGRLRDRAASLEDSDGMPSDTSLLLNEAANALEAP